MKSLCTLLLLCCLHSVTSAQLSFKRTYGRGTAQSVAQCADGGYIVSGVRAGPGDTIFLMKTNITGIPQWTKIFPGLPASLVNVLETPTGFMMAVYDDSSYIIATDAYGNVTATNRIRGYIRSMKLFSDGTIVGTGLVVPAGNLMVTRFDTQGNQLWYHLYDHPGASEMGQGVNECENGGILIAGYVRVLPNTNSALMLKLSATGVLVRQQVLSTATANTLYTVERYGSSYVFAGYGYNNNGNPPFAMLIVMTDTLFNITSTTYKDAPTCGEIFDVITGENGFAFLMEPEGAGYFRMRSGILKTSPSLTTQWEKLYDEGTPPAYGSYPWDFARCNDSGYVIASESFFYNAYNPYITLTKVDQYGNLACGDTVTAFPLTAPNFTSSAGVTSVAATTWWLQPGITADSIIAPDSIICISNPNAVSVLEHGATFDVFLLSNIVTGELVVMPRGAAAHRQYEIFSSAGACVRTGRLDPEQDVEVGDLAPGVYFIHVEKCNTMKFVKQ